MLFRLLIKKHYFFILLILAGNIFISAGQTASFQWAKSIGGTGADHAIAVALDPLNNVYFTGDFMNTVDFDPGPGTYNLTSTSVQDSYVCKLDNNGNFLWACDIGGVANDLGYSIAANSSGVYMTGHFYGTVDFDPGPGIFNLTSNGLRDIFIVKLSAAGNFQWAVSLGSTNQDIPSDITVDEGFVYLTGITDLTVDFDPGPGVYNMTTNSFILKLTSGGTFVWAKAIVNSSSDPSCIVLDSAGFIYTAGLFSGPGDFDPGPGSYVLSGGLNPYGFISKLDPSGNLVFAREFGKYNNDPPEVFAIGVDHNSNIYVTGGLYDTIDFDPGPGIYDIAPVAGALDIYILKLDAGGNFDWVKHFNGTGTSEGYSLAIDNWNNVYTAGHFMNTIDFDPGTPVAPMSSYGGFDSYVLMLDSSGSYIWSKQMGGAGLDDAISLTVDEAANIYISGNFNGTGDYDPGSGSYYLYCAGSIDMFVEKLGSLGVGIPNAPVKDNLVLFPNPSAGKIHISSGHTITDISVYNSNGNLVSHSGSCTEIDLTSCSNGIYFVRISDATIGNISEKIILQR
jgi:hypothetical protein